MIEQISLNIPEIDYRLTLQAVEEAFERYRIYKYCEFERLEPKTTPSYEGMPTGSGTTSDPTAKAAIHNANTPLEMLRYCREIERKVDNLHPNEKLLLQERFMKDYVFDYQVYNFVFNPPISESKYKEYKRNAVKKVAGALGILKYIEKPT